PCPKRFRSGSKQRLLRQPEVVRRRGPLGALADLDDRAVESGRGGALGQRALLLEFVDLCVACNQDWFGARLPGQDRLLPDRRVAWLTGLRAKDGELPCGCSALDEVDLGRRL